MQYRLAQDLDPAFQGSYIAMGLLFTDQQMYEQAIHVLSKAGPSNQRNPAVLAVTAYANARSGRADAARLAAGELSQMAGTQYVSPFFHAMALSAAGDVDAAWQQLQEAVEERSTWLPAVRFLPAFEALRQDSRFDSLMETIGLVQRVEALA